MRTTTILAIVAVVAALGAVTSLIPINQASAGFDLGPNPGTPHSTANANPNAKQHACANPTSFLHADFFC